VVSWCRLKVVQVLEAASVAVTKKEGHVSVAIVDSVDIFPFDVIKQIVFYNRVLFNSAFLGAGSFEANSIAKCKDIFVLFVLQRVFVDIDATCSVCESCVSEELVGL